jgi:hypothetical protein
MMNWPQRRESLWVEDAEGRDAGAQAQKLSGSHQTAHPTSKVENQRAPRQTQKRVNQKAYELTQKMNSLAHEKHQKKPQPQKKQQ